MRTKILVAFAAAFFTSTISFAQTVWKLGGNPAFGPNGLLTNVNNNKLGALAPNIDVLFITNNLTRMTLKSTGFVGIGTTAPMSLFHIEGGELRLTGPTPSGGPNILFGGSSTSAVNGEWGLEYTVAGSPGLNFWRPFGCTGGPTGNSFLFLANTGMVGINTNTPTAQLTVNGKTLIGDPTVITSLPGNYYLYVQNGILTEKVRVAVNGSTSWADYVFADDYKLITLNEVENFVKLNKHLPGVPSANEVEKDGIDVAQIDAVLLKKIEELTLYMISMNKEMELLKKQIKSLEATK